MDAKEVFDEVQDAGMQLFEDLKYPVDKEDNIVFLNYMHPDIIPLIVHHLIRRGYRIDPAKQLVKPRKVVGAQIPEDFITYVPMDGPDEPLKVEPQPAEKPWSVRPTVNVIDEKRPQ